MYKTTINRYLNKQQEKYFYDRHRYMVRRFGYDPMVEMDISKWIEPTCF
jgi:hypothetical protein